MAAKITGLKEVKAAIKRLDPEIRAALGGAIYQKGLQIMAESVREAPVDTGRMRATHFVAPPKVGQHNPTVEVGYGTEYAIYVHERTDLRHTAPTKAKFLQDPMFRHMPGYADWIARKTWENYQAGRGLRIASGTPTRPLAGDALGKAANKAQKAAKKAARAHRKALGLSGKGSGK